MLPLAAAHLVLVRQQMNTWDPTAVRKGFAIIAADAERYANQLSERIKRDRKRDSPFVRETHDEYLAKWYVYDSLSFGRCLESRDKLIAEVKSRLAAPFDDRNIGWFSKEDFEKHCKQHMQTLIAEHEKP